MKLALCLLAATACTRWTRTELASPSRQVGMTLVGEPHLADTTTSDTSEDYVELSTTDGVTTFSAGSLDRSRTTIHRTHCVQKALVDLEQDIELRPRVTNRAYDVFGGIGLALFGATVAGVAHEDYSFDLGTYRSQLEFHQMDPSFFPKPTEPTPPTNFYRAGAVLGIAGAGVIAFSFAALPRHRPKTERLRRRWTTETFIEASGCR